jgi:hypothetical protein
MCRPYAISLAREAFNALSPQEHRTRQGQKEMVLIKKVRLGRRLDSLYIS